MLHGAVRVFSEVAKFETHEGPPVHIKKWYMCTMYHVYNYKNTIFQYRCRLANDTLINLNNIRWKKQTIYNEHVFVISAQKSI